MDNAIQDSLSEREVIAACPRSVNTNVYYYPHHGVGGSTGSPWWQYFAPEWSLIGLKNTC